MCKTINNNATGYYNYTFFVWISWFRGVLPQSCGKIATEVDAAFRTPKNPYENLMQKIFCSHAYDQGNFQHRAYVFDADYGKLFKEKNYPAPTSEYLMRRKIAWCGQLFFDPGKNPQMRKKNEASPHDWGRTSSLPTTSRGGR